MGNASSLNIQTSDLLSSQLHALTTPALYMTWVEINRQSLHHNIGMYKRLLAPQTHLGVVLKSNAYGHGLIDVARLCQDDDAVNWILVVSVSEALALRTVGIEKPLLVLSILDNDLTGAIARNIDLVVYDSEAAHRVAAAARSVGMVAHVHLKFDTGLSRLGVLWDDVNHFIATVRSLPELSVRGIFTHLADSEQEDQNFVALQQQRLQEVIVRARALGIAPFFIHAACSAAAGAAEYAHNSLVRVGIGLYGLWPSPENKKMVQAQHPWFELKPVLTWKTRISQLKSVSAGSFIGYDRTLRVQRPTKMAILPVGYWDGFDRGMSNNGYVMIEGRLAPVIGRVAMNMTIIDVTDVASLTRESEVTLLGSSPGVTAQDLAQRCETINYEIVTRINPVLLRIVI